MPDEWVLAGKVSDISEGAAIIFEHENKKIAIFKSGGKFYAIDNTCPHRGGPLAEGHLENLEVTCPWHAWTFNLADGVCTTVPGARVKTYRVKIDGDALKVDIGS